MKTLFIRNNWKLQYITENCYHPYYMLENMKNGFGDNPLRYSDGWIVYNNPFRIPNYVKSLVSKSINKHYTEL